MSKTRLTDKASLERLLKIVVEESVSAAKDQVKRESAEDHGERHRQLQLVHQLNALSSSKNSTEEPEEVDEEEGDDMFGTNDKKQSDAEPAPTDDGSTDDGDTSDADGVQGQDDDPEGEQITYGMIKDKLNTIRSGKSLKDDEIKFELKTYFKKLSEAEQVSLHTFLSSIAGILTASIEGERADDPSDPPHDVTSTKKGSDQPAPERERAPKKSQTHSAPKARSTGEEDTAPPISVGKQHTESLRRHVRNLMVG